MPKQSNKNLLRISDIARKAGVLSSTVRYYTDMGLINTAGETRGGHRLYEETEILNTIRKIQFLNKQGLTMEQIKKDVGFSQGKKKILVIDDEPEVGEFVSGLVKDNFPNVEVKVVNDGFTAGSILNDYLPEMIVLDLMLPGINGFEVCRHIRDSELHKHVKILAITGYDTPENRAKILSCGADDFLAKPMDLKIVKARMVALLGIKEEIKNDPQPQAQVSEQKIDAGHK
jgi:CheY-like chemotaxis protein